MTAVARALDPILIRVAIYCRISRDASEQGLGVARQERECRQLAEQRGWTVVAVYTDNDITANGKKRRPSYRQMLADLQAGQFDALLVWDLDRLHRSPAELEEFLKLVEQSRLKGLTTVTGEIDLENGEGLLVARIKGAVAAEELRKMRQRQQSRKSEAVLNGEYRGGPRPYGFDKDGMTLKPKEAAFIREAARRDLLGESLYSVAKDINARGARTPRGNPFTVGTLHTILRSARISGRIESHGQIKGDAQWPAIISVQESDAIRAKSRRGPRGARPSAKVLLSGLIFCGKCGKTLRMNTGLGGNHAAYTCFKHPWGCGCGSVAIKAHLVEAYVINVLLGHVTTLETVDTAIDRHNTQSQLLVVESRADELARRWGRGDLTDGEWDAARQVLSQERQALTAQLEVLNRAQSGCRVVDPAEIAQGWEQMTIVERQAILGAYIAQIKVGKAPKRGLGGPAHVHERVHITWRR